MQLEKRREEEIAKRQGQTEITIIMAVWLIMSFLVAFAIIWQMFSTGTINPEHLRNNIEALQKLSH